MSFKKYDSIENHYQDKYILKAVSEFPELHKEKYVIREKLDGANIQLYFEPDKEFKIGKRGSFLDPDDNFFDIWNTLDNLKPLTKSFQETANETGDTIRLYGELFGRGIQNRVDYGEHKTMSFFDMELNGFLVSQYNFELYLDSLGFKNKLPPLIGYYNSLQDALEVQVEFNSKWASSESNNPSEGIVIRTYNKDYYLSTGNRFLLKKKSEKFKEKEGNQKSEKIKAELSEKVITLTLEFRSYINKNRVLSTFSKHGEIESPKQIGKYIQMITNDAKEDFLRDNNISEMKEKDLKRLFNVGMLIVPILKEYL